MSELGPSAQGHTAGTVDCHQLLGAQQQSVSQSWALISSIMIANRPQLADVVSVKRPVCFRSGSGFTRMPVLPTQADCGSKGNRKGTVPFLLHTNWDSPRAREDAWRGL